MLTGLYRIMNEGKMLLFVMRLLLLLLVPLSARADDAPSTASTIVAHSYARNAGVFDREWNKVIPTHRYDSSFKGEIRDQGFGYEALTHHHHRVMVFGCGPKYCLLLVHFVEEDRPDLAIGIQSSEPLTSDRLRECIEYLPFCMVTSTLSQGYFYTPDGKLDGSIFEGDFKEFSTAFWTEALHPTK
jgi:hypothetical protein